jgi:hypothetical protein
MWTLNISRPHTDCVSCVALKQRKKWGLRVLTPPENGAGELSGRKKVSISQENVGSRAVQFKNFMYMYSVQPPIRIMKIIGNRHTNCVLRKRAPYALRPPLPSSWVHSRTGLRLRTFTWSKPASGPEFPAPLNPMPEK